MGQTVTEGGHRRPTASTNQGAPHRGGGYGDSVSEAARDSLIGVNLGGYEIRAVLGRGGYANVYLAVQIQLEREVALKVLREDETGVRPEQVDAFLQEARTAAAFSHPNLVHVHDVGEAQGRHFLSMELVRGGNLARRIKADGPIPWRDSVMIAMDLAEALECAHDHGMLHKDVKPANVLLTRSGHAKLADLGLAGAGENVGTRGFMAPERILRKGMDQRSDLYSLGCTLYAMLVGEVPFDRPSSKQMLLAHVKETPKPVGRKGIQVPDSLEQLVADLLAKNPDDRPADAAEVFDRLDRIAARPVRPRRGRHRRNQSAVPWSTVIGLGVLFLAVVIALWAWCRFG